MNSEKNKGLNTQSLRWISAAAGGDVLERSIKPLKGGTSSILFEMAVERNSGIQEIVLRQFHDEKWLQEEPGLAKHEAVSLRFASGAGFRVPELLAYDETGEACGKPSVLMTKIPSKVVLQPDNEEKWLDSLAETLALLHQQKARNFPYEYFSYNDVLRLEKPLWSKVQDDWMRAFYIVAGIRPEAEICFIHRDYHPGNVLWQDGKVDGVVDWVNACRGPAGIDVGHCRVNLAQMYGTDVADRFLSAYQQHAGQNFEYNPYWDLLSLTDILDGTPTLYAGWGEQGMKGLSDELIRFRLDEYLLSLLDRFDD